MRLLHGLWIAAVVALAATIATCRDEAGAPPAPRAAGSTGARPGATGASRHARSTRRGPRRSSADDPADAAAEAATELDAWPGRTALLQGVVKWSDGTPVADALVTLGDIDDAGVATCSAADGTFGIDAMPFYSSVQAAAVRDGKVWSGRTPADGGPLDLDVTLTPPAPDAGELVLVHVTGWDGGFVSGGHATFVGRASDAARAPTPRTGIGGGWLAVRRGGTRRGDGFEDEVADPADAPVLVVTAPTDADGRPLPYGPAIVDLGTVEGPVAELRLPPGATLAGRVVGPDGAPVANAAIVFAPPLPAGFDASRLQTWTESVSTDDDGRFAFWGVPSGKGTLSVWAGASLARVTDLAAASGGGDLVVRLVPTIGATIRVTDAAGKPLGESYVTCDDGPSTVRLWTGADGAARLTGLRPGVRTSLTVDRHDFVRAVVDDWIAADTTVVLCADRPIEGTVCDAAGRPLPEARVVAVRRGVGPAIGPPSVYDDGSFVVPNVPEGAEAELRLVDGDRTVAAIVASAGARGVRLVWNDPGRFGVTFVRGSLERWALGPLVTLRSDGSDRATVAWSAATIVTLEAAGLPDRADVQIGPLADGRWALVPGATIRGLLRVPDDAWRTGRPLDGRVTAPDGAPWTEAATIVVTDGAGYAVRCRTRRDGTYRIPGVPTAVLSVHAESADGRTSETRTLEAGEDGATLEVRLRE